MGAPVGVEWLNKGCMYSTVRVLKYLVMILLQLKISDFFQNYYIECIWK